jgi:hypothetical protein
MVAPGLAQGRDLCIQWCTQNLAREALSCIGLAALGTGPCYICGPHKSSPTEQLCSGSCAQTNTDNKNCGKCGNVVSPSTFLIAKAIEQCSSFFSVLLDRPVNQEPAYVRTLVSLPAMAPVLLLAQTTKIAGSVAML